MSSRRAGPGWTNRPPVLVPIRIGPLPASGLDPDGRSQPRGRHVRSTRQPLAGGGIAGRAATRRPNRAENDALPAPWFWRDPLRCWCHRGGVTTSQAEQLLEAFRTGKISRARVLRAFQTAPVADLGFARVDLHRALRKGCPEVIFGAGKTATQVLGIAARLLERKQNVLVTRATKDQARRLQKQFKEARYHALAGCVTVEKWPSAKRPGLIGIVSAGTSDLPVAQEAAVTAAWMGNEIVEVHDVGVAGLHRILSRLEVLQQANVLVVVAGMEGALPSVVAGLVDRPVIAVPTSVGYGASFGGLAALLGMLNSCSSGVTVVNIDNGFGAGYAASQINALASPAAPPARRRKRKEQ